MFDLEKLDVYQKSKSFCKEIYSILDEKNFDRVTAQVGRLILTLTLSTSQSAFADTLILFNFDFI